MAKLAFLAAVLVALVAFSAAEEDNILQPLCLRELQQSSLQACRQVVDHQLAAQLPFLLPRSSQLRTGVRLQCCQQLVDISPVCRAAAIRQMVSQYEHQAVVPLREDPYYHGEDEEQQEEGSYYPGESYPQPQPWWSQPQQGQGSYQPSKTIPQQQEQGSCRPSQTYRPQQPQQGSYQQEQQEGGIYGQSTGLPQQEQHGRRGPYRFHAVISRRGQQQEGQGGQYSGRPSQQTGFGGFLLPPRVGTDQHAAARLRMQLKVVGTARQVASQLPVMCMLERRAFSAGQH